MVQALRVLCDYLYHQFSLSSANEAVWDCQADARTLKDVHRNVDSMSDTQQLQGVDALKNVKTLSAKQLDAVFAIQMMTEKWNNGVRPGFVPRDHGEVLACLPSGRIIGFLRAGRSNTA